MYLLYVWLASVIVGQHRLSLDLSGSLPQCKIIIYYLSLFCSSSVENKLFFFWLTRVFFSIHPCQKENLWGIIGADFSIGWISFPFTQPAALTRRQWHCQDPVRGVHNMNIICLMCNDTK